MRDWGVLYTIIGATPGVCLAFLDSPYMAGNLLNSKLTGPRWRTLNKPVEAHDWKTVDYAFGLSRIKFTHYALTTVLCMLNVLFLLPLQSAFSETSPVLTKEHPVAIDKGARSVSFLAGVNSKSERSILPSCQNSWHASGMDIIQSSR